MLNFSKAVEQGADDGEEFWLVGLDDNGEHLAIQVVCDVVGSYKGLELLESVFVVEELPSSGQMFPQVVVLQTQLIEDNRGSVGSEAATVQPDVEQPVIVVARFLGG